MTAIDRAISRCLTQRDTFQALWLGYNCDCKLWSDKANRYHRAAEKLSKLKERRMREGGFKLTGDALKREEP